MDRNDETIFPDGYITDDPALALQAFDYFNACAANFRARLMACEPRTAEFDAAFDAMKRAEFDAARMRVFLLDPEG